LSAWETESCNGGDRGGQLGVRDGERGATQPAQPAARPEPEQQRGTERQQDEQPGGGTGEDRAGVRAYLPVAGHRVEARGQLELEIVEVPQGVALRDVPPVRVDLELGEVDVRAEQRGPHRVGLHDVVAVHHVGVPGQLVRGGAPGELGEPFVLRPGQLPQLGELGRGHRPAPVHLGEQVAFLGAEVLRRGDRADRARGRGQLRIAELGR
jgi:hypothetical protein